MLARSPSGTIRSKTSIENVTAALNQKDKMVELLKRELDGFASLRQDYDRLRDRRTHLLDKCDAVNREITLSRESQNRKATSDLDMIQDLASVVLSLEKDLQNKSYHLKTLKCQTQTLLASNDQKDQDLTQCLDAIEAVKEAGETLKMERDRLRLQLNVAEDEISKVSHSCHQAMGSNEKVRNQVHSTQSFIRSLENQEMNIGNKLSTLEDQNNALDAIIEDLDSVLEMTKQKSKEVKLNKETVEFKIQAKKLDKGRIDTEYSEGHKKFKAEREKQRRLREQIDSKKAELQRITLMNKEVTEQTENAISSNLEIQDINGQLRADLEVCKRHLENVMRVNSTVQDSLQEYKKTNMVVIKKLKKPIDEGWTELNTYAKSELAESTAENFNLARI